MSLNKCRRVSANYLFLQLMVWSSACVCVCASQFMTPLTPPNCFIVAAASSAQRIRCSSATLSALRSSAASAIAAQAMTSNDRLLLQSAALWPQFIRNCCGVYTCLTKIVAESHAQHVEVAQYGTHFIVVIITITTAATETHCHPLKLCDEPLAGNVLVDGGDGASHTIVITITKVTSKQPLSSYRVFVYFLCIF